MKTIPQLQLTRAFRFRETFLTLLAVCFAAGLAATHAAAPTLQPLVQPGKWPSSGYAAARGVTVSGNYAYVADGGAGLHSRVIMERRLNFESTIRTTARCLVAMEL